MRGQPTSHQKRAILGYQESSQKHPVNTVWTNGLCEDASSGKTRHSKVQTSLEESRVMAGPAQEAMRNLGTKGQCLPHCGGGGGWQDGCRGGG